MEVGAACSSSSASWPAGTRGGVGRASEAGRDEPNDSAEAKPAGVGADPGFGDGFAAARTVKASVVSSGAGVATGFGAGFGAAIGWILGGCLVLVVLTVLMFGGCAALLAGGSG